MQTWPTAKRSANLVQPAKVKAKAAVQSVLGLAMATVSAWAAVE
jgi:hypothetical protein